jgi:hypothetical protein
MRAETAERVSDVVIGTATVNSHPATVLFDFGASHAFMSADFVKKNMMLTQPMGITMVVSTPEGELRATLSCPHIAMVLRGVEFKIHPKVLNSLGIELIFGASWLKRRNAMMHCSERTVQLVAPSGEEVEYQTVSTLEHCQSNEDEGAAKGLDRTRESRKWSNRSDQGKHLDSEGMISRQKIHKSRGRDSF